MSVVRKEEEKKVVGAAARPGLLGELSADVLRTSPEAPPEPERKPSPAPIPASPGLEPNRCPELACSH